MSTYVTSLAKKFNLRKEDAKEPISIEVFPKDVKKAVRYDSSCCAFACAAKRELPIEGAIFFRSTAWLLFPGGVLRRYMLTPAAMKQVKTFDRGQGMKPGMYQLSPPSSTNSMKAIKRRSKKRPGHHKAGAGVIQRKPVHHAKDVRTAHMPQLPPGLLVKDAAKAMGLKRELVGP